MAQPARQPRKKKAAPTPKRAGKVADAQRAEATTEDPNSEGWEVPFRGLVFRIPPQEQWDVDVFEAFENDKIVTALKALLGPVQWAMFREAGRGMAAVGELYEVLEEVVGLGESSGSGA